MKQLLRNNVIWFYAVLKTFLFCVKYLPAALTVYTCEKVPEELLLLYDIKYNLIIIHILQMNRNILNDQLVK